jgi:hypothetical protein
VRQAVEEGVQDTGTDAVAVTAELLDHSEAENFSFRGVMEHLKLDQPSRYRKPLSIGTLC